VQRKEVLKGREEKRVQERGGPESRKSPATHVGENRIAGELSQLRINLYTEPSRKVCFGALGWQEREGLECEKEDEEEEERGSRRVWFSIHIPSDLEDDLVRPGTPTMRRPMRIRSLQPTI